MIFAHKKVIIIIILFFIFLTMIAFTNYDCVAGYRSSQKIKTVLKMMGLYEITSKSFGLLTTYSAKKYFSTRLKVYFIVQNHFKS